MNRTLTFFSIAIFSVFLGSQITEGCLLVPYWQTLSEVAFYDHYAEFGPAIGKFYTTLTIIATLIPISIGTHCYFKKSRALKYACISVFFSFLVIALFYLYFKHTNQQFYELAFSANELKSALKTWGYWHWLRVFFEFLSLIFLIRTFTILLRERTSEELKTIQ